MTNDHRKWNSQAFMSMTDFNEHWRTFTDIQSKGGGFKSQPGTNALGATLIHVCLSPPRLLDYEHGTWNNVGALGLSLIWALYMKAVLVFFIRLHTNGWLGHMGAPNPNLEPPNLLEFNIGGMYLYTLSAYQTPFKKKISVEPCFIPCSEARHRSPVVTMQ